MTKDRCRLRAIPTITGLSGSNRPTTLWNSSTLEMGCRLICSITSPGLNSCATAELGSTRVTITPFTFGGTLASVRNRGVRFCTSMPPKMALCESPDGLGEIWLRLRRATRSAGCSITFAVTVLASPSRTRSIVRLEPMSDSAMRLTRATVSLTS